MEYIKKRRKEFNLTLEQLAGVAEISPRRLSNFEKGNTDLTLSQMAKICDRLNLMLLITSKETTIKVL